VDELSVTIGSEERLALTDEPSMIEPRALIVRQRVEGILNHLQLYRGTSNHLNIIERREVRDNKAKANHQ